MNALYHKKDAYAGKCTPWEKVWLAPAFTAPNFQHIGLLPKM